MTDFISRQAAIEAVIAEGRNVDSRYLESERIIHESDAVEVLSLLPSARPEIIRCKDCRYSVDEYDDGDCYCKKSCSWHGANWDFYCAAAERREE